ncbi:aminotransferase class I/II-fold pyridoxal phosphate-dependent enzyme [Salinimonas sp. HHU 13199]|uniref:cysteine-S-conjugate beta-lyase n=1 Tax=Salinimonas profundi TaxID=2729140 RepID=A0ABR8LHI2_9ALTE|nr:aminotransferase class I/II-fold pyridoxal phosphate-dependent enzyme [Salinimonas profundi]MBD3584426.1 aminotransferase class I/II-fold pyridoxal phosphate-dependent enzyme [Salinimonas profundi]
MSIFIEREGTGSLKYEGVKQKFGVSYPDMVSMWIADMDVALPPAVQGAINHCIASCAVGYQSVPIEPAVVKWLAKEGTYIEPDWIVPCSGVLSTLYLTLTLYSKPHAKVAVISPTYSPLYDAVRDTGRELQVVPAHQDIAGRWSLGVEDIDPDCSMLLLCNPQNPTGHVWRKTQLSAIADYCRQHGIMIICDEIHADFVFEQPFFSLTTSMTACCDNIIVLRSASKSFNLAGIDNAAYAVSASPQIRDTLRNALGRRHLVPAPLACHVLNTAYNACDDWFSAMLAAISSNRKLVADASSELPEALALHLGEGTYFALLDARRLSDDPARTILNNYHLALGQGDEEFAPGLFRLNLATSPGRVQEVMERLAGHSV